MWQYVKRILLITCLAFSQLANGAAVNRLADNWSLVELDNVFWLKTVNNEQKTLLFSYDENNFQFIFISNEPVLKSLSLAAEQKLSVSLKIDRGEKQFFRYQIIEKHQSQIVLRIVIDGKENNTHLSQMINGLVLSLGFQLPSQNNLIIKDNVSFSLKGFTVALNDLLIAKEIGSLDPRWLLQHKKDRELYCLMTTDISIKVMQYRLDGKTYNNVLHRLPKTGYSLIDHNLGEIIEQVYKLPMKNITNVPRAEKYKMFSNCMMKPF